MSTQNKLLQKFEVGEPKRTDAQVSAFGLALAAGSPRLARSQWKAVILQPHAGTGCANTPD